MLEQTEDEIVTTPPARLIRLKEVMRRVGLGRSTIYRWMDEGKFPRPVQLGGHSVAWVEKEVHDWIMSKINTNVI